MSTVVPLGYSSLTQYVTDHPNQTEDVTQTIKDCTVAVLDTVEAALRNRPGAESDTAYDSIRGLQKAYRNIIPVGVKRATEQNQAAAAIQESFKKTGSADIDGHRVTLAEPLVETSTEGLIQPPGGNVQAAFELADGERLVKATARYGERSDVPFDQYATHENRGVVARPGVEQAARVLDDLSPLVRSLMIDPHVSPSTISAASEASHQELMVEHTRQPRYLVRTETTDRTRFLQDSASQSMTNPALVSAIQGLDTLRDLVETMHSMPAVTQPIKVIRGLTESVDTDRDFTVHRLFRHDTVNTRDYTGQKVAFDGLDHYTTSRTVGQVELAPAYLTMDPVPEG